MSTKIEWTDEVWNPVTGCTPVSEGCKNCYAKRMARRLAGRYGYPEKPNHFDVTLHSDRLERPLRWRKPRRIFVCSMGDLFHEDVPDDFICRVFNIMADARTEEHTFQVLTKQPERMFKFITDNADIVWSANYDTPLHVAQEVGDWPLSNVWLGVTAENQQAADERIPLLLQTPAAVRFVSCEPLLSPIDFTDIEVESAVSCNALRVDDSFLGTHRRHVDWVIAGGETGPGARPMHPDWARSLRDQCQAAGVRFFFKQWGKWAPSTQVDYREQAHAGGFASVCPTCSAWSSLPFGPNCDCDTIAHDILNFGKKAAGRLLDGKEWNEIPGVAQR